MQVLPIVSAISGRQRRVVLAGAWLLLGVVVGIDYLAGPDLGLLVLYLLPVILAALLGGVAASVAISCAAAALGLAADALHRPAGAGAILLLANAALRLASFLIVAGILRLLRREVDRARRDPLTGAGNRRFFLELAERELGVARRHGRPFSLAFLDLDDFKEVNDRFGHAAGDALLRWVAGSVGAAVRSTDVFARLGGDEFVILMPETDAAAAGRVVEKLRGLAAPPGITGGVPATFSIGLVTFPSAPGSLDLVLEAADRAMYDAKRLGKGAVRAVVAS